MDALNSLKARRAEIDREIEQATLLGTYTGAMKIVHTQTLYTYSIKWEDSEMWGVVVCHRHENDELSFMVSDPQGKYLDRTHPMYWRLIEIVKPWHRETCGTRDI